MKPAALFIDDDRASTESLVRALAAAGLTAQCYTASTADHAAALAREHQPHVAVLDLSLDPARGVESGFALLTELLIIAPDARIVVLTGHGATEFGVRALHLGASSFLQKPADVPHLAAVLRDGIAQAELRRGRSNLERAHSPLIGESPQMRAVITAIHNAARTNQAVLFTGETGTGKGVCARALHHLSSRAGRRFVRYQPTFATPDLVQSDLFGHVRGAFTGAAGERRGLIAEADGGTLFLDEIDELPGETQVGLLGVLQEKRFRPVGSSHEVESNFRLAAASNRDLDEAVKTKKLRADLYHRIAHAVIHIPPLRERLDDIPPLARNVLARLASHERLDVLDIDSGAMAKLGAHAWLGNVRELEAVVESAAYRASFAGRSSISEADIQFNNRERGPGSAGDFHAQVEAFKLKLIEAALERNSGNQLRAAAELGLDRGTIARIIRRR